MIEAVLIIYLFTGSATTGMAVTTATFASMEACTAAGEKAKREIGGWATGVRFSCSPRSTNQN